MTIKTTLPLMMAIPLLLLAGCKKGETAPTANPDESGASAIGAAPTSTAAAGAVASYSDMVPQSGTKQLLQDFVVYQAADTSSAILSRVSRGQWINLKGSHANWMLIEWPSGVGQVSPGWIELRGGVNDTRLAQSPPVDAGKPVDAGTVDAGAPVDAGAKDGGGIILIVRDGGAGASDGGPRGIIIKPRH
jgi:hypothetical protein